MLSLDGRSKEKKIEDARKLLEDNGYLIRGPLILKSNVRGPADLVKFFYDAMAKYNPGLVMQYSPSRSRDLGLAKKFIEARQASGISKERAAGECCIIIDSLFKYENSLGLNSKVNSISILGQESLGWITEKVLDIINGFNKDIAQKQDDAWFERFYKEQEESISDRLILEANKVLGIEDKDGKEK